jgi:myo-inositol-1(or 4)-monophosphatase
LSPEEWERLLLFATRRVMGTVSSLAVGRERRKTVGIGASGDKTILADKLAEDELLRSLDGKGARVLSEEAGLVGDPLSKTLAVVDPLDGSSNFERGIPFYCTSIAVVEGTSVEDIKVGVVRDLVTGDVYAATKGGGARKNGKAIKTSGTLSPPSAVVGIDLSRSTGAQVSRLASLISGVKRHVHLGANALELCYLAEGRIDASIDLRGKIRITDLAAGYLIASEAGARVTGEDGRMLKPMFDLEHRLSFVASANSSLHREILKLCNSSSSGRGVNRN